MWIDRWLIVAGWLLLWWWWSANLCWYGTCSSWSIHFRRIYRNGKTNFMAWLRFEVNGDPCLTQTTADNFRMGSVTICGLINCLYTANCTVVLNTLQIRWKQNLKKKWIKSFCIKFVGFFLLVSPTDLHLVEKQMCH